jgi:hypothetical protein
MRTKPSFAQTLAALVQRLMVDRPVPPHSGFDRFVPQHRKGRILTQMKEGDARGAPRWRQPE